MTRRNSIDGFPPEVRRMSAGFISADFRTTRDWS